MTAYSKWVDASPSAAMRPWPRRGGRRTRRCSATRTFWPWCRCRASRSVRLTRHTRRRRVGGPARAVEVDGHAGGRRRGDVAGPLAERAARRRGKHQGLGANALGAGGARRGHARRPRQVGGRPRGEYPKPAERRGHGRLPRHGSAQERPQGPGRRHLHGLHHGQLRNFAVGFTPGKGEDPAKAVFDKLMAHIRNATAKKMPPK